MASLSHEGLERDEDWTERFIEIIQGKPAIYNSTMKEHGDRNYITRQWNEVCEMVVPTWHDMTLHERALKAKELQQRWRNLRTCFRRELNKQRNPRPGESVKRRKYIYFDKLLFLLPMIGERDNMSEPSPPQTEEETSETELCLGEDPLEQVNLPQYTLPTLSLKRSSSYDGPLLNVIEGKKFDDVDEDKLFLLSLIPSFRKMSTNQKIEAKIEFLSVIRRIFQNHHV